MATGEEAETGFGDPTLIHAEVNMFMLILIFLCRIVEGLSYIGSVATSR
jgi:hypothetical protein